MPLRSFPLLVTLLASPTALAHYPHDVAHWGAVSPDPAQPRWATSLERINMDIMGRSEDGLSWEARLVPAARDGDGTFSGAFLTPQRLVLATELAGLQVSEDAGDTWTQEPSIGATRIARVVASPAILDDGLAYVAAAGAVWRSEDAGVSWVPVWESLGEGFTDVDLSPEFATDGRLCALEADGLSCSQDFGDSWLRRPVPPDVHRVSVGAEGRLWAAVRGEGLYRSEDEGATWTIADFAGEDVVAIAELADGLVLLAFALEAGMRSVDGGESWEAVDILTITDDQTRDGVNFFDFFAGPDGAVYLTCWFGLARSYDGGQSFEFFNTERIENTHSVMLTRGENGAAQAWIGTYGGGPLLVDLEGRKASTFPDLPLRFTRNTPTTRAWGRDGVAIFDEGYTTFRTVDHGASWESFEEVMNTDHQDLSNDVKGVAVAPDTSVDPFLLLNVGQGAMDFWVSEDLGESWTVGTQDPPCTELGLAAALSPRWPEESRAWASCHGVVYESVDRGVSWSSLGDTGAFVFEVAERPDGALLIATRDGLWLHDGQTLEQIAFAGALVTSVATAPDALDDTAFALVPTQGWMRSDDGGESWVTLTAPTADLPRMISLSPGFAEDGLVAVAGYGGAWASADRGETWGSIYGLEVYESDHDAWRSSGSWSTDLWQAASGRKVTVSAEPGASKALDFLGERAALLVPADAATGVLTVSLDGGDPQQAALPPEDGVAWSVEGLDDGWHSLRIEVVEGTVTVDALRLTRAGWTAAEAPVEDGGCSCRRSGRDSGLSALLLFPVFLLRRRRGAPMRRLGDRA
jgi:hypothetical protein